MDDHISPFAPVIVTTLENLLAPGGRARISPYVESAQFQVLFGKRPDPKNRVDQVRRILHDHAARIESLTQQWYVFSQQGKQFAAQDYDSQEFRDMYLAYYCTVNVAKVQLCLLELVQSEVLCQSHLDVLDIGVGTGTTMLGLMDFLILWATVCDLYGAAFPIQTVQFTGIDYLSGNLAYAQNVATAYADALAERIAYPGESATETMNAHVEQWTRAARWEQHDLGQSSYRTRPGNLILAANVLNELRRQDNQRESQTSGATHLQNLIAGLPPGGVAVVIEPGTERETHGLMGWRQDIMRRVATLHALGACAMGGDPAHAHACTSCWNARRESLHQPPLYLRFRQEAARLGGDTRPFDDFKNNLLSWSYILLHQRDQQRPPPQIATYTIANEQCWTSEAPLRLTYVGSFRGNKQTRTTDVATYHPDRTLASTDQQWVEFVKFCAARCGNAQSITLWRTDGTHIPALRYGDVVEVSGITARCSDTHQNIRLEPDSDTHITVHNAALSGAETFLHAYTARTERAINEIAYRLFGFPAMRPFQHRILAQVVTGKPILGIAATGGGKSECYILPAMILPGITVVVSPLKSLMMDQYEQRICERYGLGDLTTVINSDVPFYERQKRLIRLEQGHYKLIYMTPEQLERSYILHSLNRANQRVGIRYLALDEAHCISQWGHDFRPSYLNLVQRLRTYAINPATIALTATASPEVRRDLCEELHLDARMVEQGGNVYIESSNRPELNLVVRVCRNTDEKATRMLEDLRQLQKDNAHNDQPGAAIVFLPWTGGNPDNYAAEPGTNQGRYSIGVTRFAAYLEQALQQQVAIYHGKMDDDTNTDSDTLPDADSQALVPLGDMRGRSRRMEQQAFIKGQREIMVATKGFGMGIDKPNIRLVLHRTPPGNLEAYAQEAGRAGRDGEQATVVLYYSPDKPEDPAEQGTNSTRQRRWASSDHEIQSFFLSDRYIRAEDVRVMGAFLRQVTRQIQGRLYFTNDEVIAFFDACATNPCKASLSEHFEWPTFEDRKASGKESDEHADILDRGHTYTKKTEYIQRILDVLYRVRPTLGAQAPREAMILELHECGTVLKKQDVKNAEGILGSNAYFGQVLRNAGLTAPELRRMLQNGDLLELAQRLQRPLSDVVQMVSDMKHCELTRFKEPVLLDYWFIEAPYYGPAAGKTELDAWRDYAGARTRAYGKKAYERARKAGREHNGRSQETTLDDWFGWSEVSRRTGWEVLPGPALEREDDFEEYLTAFVRLHDERERNDWAAYRRLLSDYVGVNPDSGDIAENPNQQCLRAVLLGYLKTYEVIQGESCYGCSRCVRDEQFGRYSVQQRRDVIVRLTEEVERLLGSAEAMTATIPSPELVDELLTAIQQEQARGRSLAAYVQGWSGRLLQDNPGHRAALVIRIQTMVQGVADMQPGDVVTMLQTLGDQATADEYDQVQAVLDAVQPHLPDELDIYRLRIELARKGNQPEGESQVWEAMLPVLLRHPHTTHANLMEAHTTLVTLYSTALNDVERAHYHRLHVARYSPDFQTAAPWYRQVSGSWNWTHVMAEQDVLHTAQRPDLIPALLGVWLQSGEHDRASTIAVFLADTPTLWQSWPPEALAYLVEQLPDDVLPRCPAAVAQMVREHRTTDRLYTYVSVALEQGERFAAPDIADILARSTHCPDRDTLLDALATHPEVRLMVYQALQANFVPQTWVDMDWVLTHFQPELAAAGVDVQQHWLRHAVRVLPQGNDRAQALAVLHMLAQPLLKDSDAAPEGHALWQTACVGVPDVALKYVFQCATVAGGWQYITQFLDMLYQQDQPTRQTIYATLKQRFRPRTWRSVEQWLQMFAPEIAAEPPEERINLWRIALPLLPDGTARAAALRSLQPENLCPDATFAAEVHAAWQQACANNVEATSNYLEHCEHLSGGIGYASQFIAHLRAQTPTLVQTVAEATRQRMHERRWSDVVMWLTWFGPEIANAPPNNRITWLAQAMSLLPDKQRCAEATQYLQPIVADLFTHPEHAGEVHAIWQHACVATPEEVLTWLTVPTTEQAMTTHLWQFLDTWLPKAADYFPGDDGISQQLLQCMVHQMPAENSQNPQAFAHILRVLRYLVSDTDGFAEACQLVRQVLPADPQSIVAYVNVCDETPESSVCADETLAQMRQAQAKLFHKVYEILRHQRDTNLDDWTVFEFEYWVRRFGSEITNDPQYEGRLFLESSLQPFLAFAKHAQTLHSVYALAQYLFLFSETHKQWREWIGYQTQVMVEYRKLCQELRKNVFWERFLIRMVLYNFPYVVSYTDWLLKHDAMITTIAQDMQTIRDYNQQATQDICTKQVEQSNIDNWKTIQRWLHVFLPDIVSISHDLRRKFVLRAVAVLPDDQEIAYTTLDNVRYVAQSLFAESAFVDDVHQVCQQLCLRNAALLNAYFDQCVQTQPRSIAPLVAFAMQVQNTHPHLFEQIYQRIKVQPTPQNWTDFVARLAICAPLLVQEEDFWQRAHVFQEVIRLWPADQRSSAAIEQIMALARSMFPNQEAMSRMLEVWQQVHANDTTDLVHLLTDEQQREDAAFATDLLLDLFLKAGDLTLLAQLEPRVLNTRWRQAVQMITVLRDFFYATGYIPATEPTSETFQALVQHFDAFHNPEGADMYVVAALQLRTWINQHWLTPLSWTGEVLVKHGRFDAARQLAAKYERLQLGRERLSVEAYIQQSAKDIAVCGVPLNRDYQVIAVRILGTGSAPSDVALLLGPEPTSVSLATSALKYG